MSTSSERIAVVLIDDHALFREGVREILGTHADLDIVGEAGDSNHAISMVEKAQPDVVLLDVGIPGDHVTVTVSKIAKVSPDTRVIILTMYDDSKLLHDLLALGISGYLLKDTTHSELVSAIRRSRARERNVTLSVSRESLTRAKASDVVLSPRELDVLRLVSLAKSNMQIARELALTEATVKRHIHNIFVKLGAVSRIDAVNKAVRAALLPTRSPITDCATGNG